MMSEEDILDEAPGAEVEALLPDGHEYVIQEIKPISGNGFLGVFRIDLKSEDEILIWLEEYQQRNYITLEEVDTENVLENEFSKVYKCVETINTPCDATIKTTLKNINMKNTTDKFIKTHPCEIFIAHSHNHALSISIIQFQQWFELLFQEGHSPKSALNKIKEELLLQFGEDYFESDPTGKTCLCESWVNEYYSTLYEEPYEEPSQEEYSELEIFIHEFNDKCGDVCAMVKDQSTITICSPLMKRNWTLINEVEEVIYVDSSVLDKQNTRIMLFLCQSRLGILPLGILLLPCKDEDGECIIEGIKLLRLMLPENAKTPKLMIVADTNEQRCNLLKNCFNIENVLICKIFVQKAALKWLWNHKNRLNKAERINIYVTFIKTLHCSKVQEFEASYENLQKLTSIPKNKKTFNYFENLRVTASLWATCYRQNQKYDTNDYSKIIFKVLENVPAKTLNNLQLFACVASSFENYFFNRLTKLTSCDSLTSEHIDSWQGCSSSVFDCREIGDNLYSVMEETKINIINRSIDYCTCTVNQNIVPCRHKWAIISAFNFKDDVYPLDKEELKELIENLLIDNECTLKGWYDDHKKLDQLNSDVENTGQISNDVDPRMAEIRNKLENTIKTIMQKLTLNRTLFTEPVEKFITDFENCKTDDALVSALLGFSKPKVTANSVAKKRANATSASGNVKQKPVVKKSQNNLAPVANKQNSASNLVFKELLGSDLVMKNNIYNNIINEGGSVKKKKTF